MSRVGEMHSTRTICFSLSLALLKNRWLWPLSQSLSLSLCPDLEALTVRVHATARGTVSLFRRTGKRESYPDGHISMSGIQTEDTC